MSKTTDVRDLLWQVANQGSTLIDRADMVRDCLEATLKMAGELLSDPDKSGEEKVREFEMWGRLFAGDNIKRYDEARAKGVRS